MKGIAHRERRAMANKPMVFDTYCDEYREIDRSDFDRDYRRDEEYIKEIERKETKDNDSRHED